MRMRPIHLPATTLAHNFHPRCTPGLLAAFLVLTILTNAVVFSVSFAGSINRLIDRFGSGRPTKNFATTVPGKSTGANKTSLVTALAGFEMADASLIVARKDHTSTLLSDGKILIVGGENQNGFVTEAEIFDPSTGDFRVSGNLNTPRADHTATRLADGRVLIAAGRGDLGVLSTTEIFDPASGVFSYGPSLKTARAGQSATVLSDGRILFAGGDDSGSAEIYDPSTNSFALLGASMTTPRAFHGAALLNDGRILLAGGTAADGSEVLSGEILNIAVPSFETVASSLRDEHVRPTMRVLPDGKVQVIGGSDHEVIEVYDRSINQFGAHAHVYPIGDDHPELVQQLLGAPTRAALFRPGSANALTNRGGHAITELPGSNQALVTGGADSNGTILNSASVLNSSGATITTAGSTILPACR